MKQNMGSLDRTIRLVGAVFLLIISLLNPIPDTSGIITYVFIALLLLTAATGYCPFYALLRMNSNRR